MDLKPLLLIILFNITIFHARQRTEISIARHFSYFHSLGLQSPKRGPEFGILSIYSEFYIFKGSGTHSTVSCLSLFCCLITENIASHPQGWNVFKFCRSNTWIIMLREISFQNKTKTKSKAKISKLRRLTFWKNKVFFFSDKVLIHMAD